MTPAERLHQALHTYAHAKTRSNARNVLLAVDWKQAPAPDSKPPSRRLAEALREWQGRRSRNNAQAVFGALGWTAAPDEQSVLQAAVLLQNAAAWSNAHQPANGAADEHGTEPAAERSDAAVEDDANAAAADKGIPTKAEQISVLAQALVRDLDQTRSAWEQSERGSRLKQERIDGLEQALAEARTVGTVSEEEGRIKTERIKQLADELDAARIDWAASEEDSRTKKQRIEHLELELQQIQARYEESEADSRQKREQIGRLELDLEEVHTMYKELEEDSQQKRGQIEQLDQDLRQVHAMYKESEEESRQQRGQIEQLERHLLRTIAERGGPGQPDTPAEAELKGDLAAITRLWRQAEEESEAKREQITQLEDHLKTAREDWELSEEDSREKQEQLEQMEADLKKVMADRAQSREDSSVKQQEIKRQDQQIAWLDERIRHLEGQVDALQAHSEAHWSKALAPASFADLMPAAQRHLNRLVVPGTAARDIDKLDRHHNRGTWVPDAWKALCALQAYAEAGPLFDGNFAAWCLNGQNQHAWYPDRLAMTDGAAAMARFGETRIFSVDHRVDPSGKIEMQAHIKVVKAGDENIPRIYFHDDTAGVTKRVHIGFIGPHSLVPASKF